MKNHAACSFWPGLVAGASLIVALNASLPAGAQTITLPNGLVYAGCQVVGSGGNNINNLNFLPVPKYISGSPGDGSTKVSILEWNGMGFNQYVYFNCADSPDGQLGWYTASEKLANVTWNPGEGMVLHNSSASTVYTLTLNGTTPATPVVPPFNYNGCGEWSFLSSQTPNTSSTYQQVTGFSPVDGSEVAYTDGAGGPVVSYTYQSGAWAPAGTPTVVNDQAAFFFVPCPTASGTFTGPSVTGPPVPGVTPSTTSVGVWNIYAYETASPTTYGVDPDSLFGGDLVSPSSVINLPAGGSGPVTWSDSFSSGSSASVSASFAADPSGNGLIITLNNPNSSADEVRFDWVNNYQHSGPPNTINDYSITCSGSITGSGYWEVASGENLLVYDPSGNNLGTATASTASAGGTAHKYGPAGAGPWLGSMAIGSFNQSYTLPFSPTATISGSDFVLANGYIDVIVDPGTFQIQIGTPPNLGIVNYSNSPVVLFPSSAGNWTVQMTTNLLTGSWVTVTNGVPFTGVQIPNPTGPAFFRVK
ncbi:MAG TPA: hypothetical protein VGJ73_02505 [Verrucomicrobiae bacterium]